MGSLSDLLEQQAVNRSRLIEEPQAHSNLEVRVRCIESRFCSANCGWWYGEECAWSIVIESLRVRSSGFWHLIRRDCQLVCMLNSKDVFSTCWKPVDSWYAVFKSDLLVEQLFLRIELDMKNTQTLSGCPFACISLHFRTYHQVHS